MKQGNEAMPGLRGRMISKEEFGEFASQIRGLRYNAFDTSQNQTQEGSYGQRKGDLKEIHKEMKQPGEHEHVFVAFDAEDNVVGFMAVHTTPGGRIAEAEEMWTKLPGHKQRAIVGKLLGAARSYLTNHGYPRLTAAPKHASSDFSVVGRGEDFHRFVKMEKGETAEEPMFDMPEVGSESIVPEVAVDIDSSMDQDAGMNEAA